MGQEFFVPARTLIGVKASACIALPRRPPWSTISNKTHKTLTKHNFQLATTVHFECQLLVRISYPKTDPLLRSSILQASFKCETPRLELKSLRSFLAIKRCQRKKIEKLLSQHEARFLSGRISATIGVKLLKGLMHKLCIPNEWHPSRFLSLDSLIIQLTELFLRVRCSVRKKTWCFFPRQKSRRRSPTCYATRL